MSPKPDKLVVKNGWVTCPICRKNHHWLFVDEDTEAECFPVYCRDCKQTVKVKIARGRSVERRSP